MLKTDDLRIKLLYLNLRIENTNLKTSIKMNRKKYTLALLALCCTGGAFSQSLNQAKNWFNEGKFAEAKPVFQRLVKQSPSNTNYNYWYGACCYETGEVHASVPYLEKAAARKMINGYLYLSKAYYDLYRFDEAVENLEEHIYWLERKNRDTAEAEELMVKLRKGTNMIRGVENIAVIDSFVVDKQQFLDAYKISKEVGTLAMAKDSACTVYTNEMGDKNFFAQRNEEGNSSLYASIKMIDQWSRPSLQKGLDEGLSQLNYPFMCSDGITLYFAAQGEESMGGYDIFITRADSEENSFLKPDNIGLPFNSPANDYMYALDDYNNLGWFASDRYQPEGKVCVYVFVPNEQKIVHDFDQTDPAKLQEVASLRSIASTQQDEDVVRTGKQHLAQVLYGQQETKDKGDFRFVVDDSSVYHVLTDFRSAAAKKLFMEMTQMKVDLQSLNNDLRDLRKQYVSMDEAGKANLSPAILDKEKRAEQLYEELNTKSVEVRNVELQARGKK